MRFWRSRRDPSVAARADYDRAVYSTDPDWDSYPDGPETGASALMQETAVAKLDDFRPVLVVGASGQLGTRVVQQLAAAQRPVRAFVRPTSQQAHLRLPGVELVQGDLGDAASIDAACRVRGAMGKKGV